MCINTAVREEKKCQTISLRELLDILQKQFKIPLIKL